VSAAEFVGKPKLDYSESVSKGWGNRVTTAGIGSAKRSFVIGALVGAALLLPLLRGFEKPATAMDEGSLLVYPELLLKGNLPYRDFETFYGPANIYLLSGIYSAFGPSIFAERATGLVYRLLILGAVFCLGLRWGSTVAAGATLIAGALLLQLGVVAYAWMGGVACALWAIFLISKVDSLVCCFFGGLLAAAALLFRPDLGPAVTLGSLPLFLVMARASKVRFLSGVCLALCPLGVLTIAAGPQNVLDNLFLRPVFENAGRHLPLGQATGFVRGLFAAHLVASSLNIVAGVIASRRPSAPEIGRSLLAIALFTLALTHQAIQRADGMHVLFAAFASLAILPISCFVLLSQTGFLSARHKPVIAVGLAAVCVTLFVPALPFQVSREFVAASNPNSRGAFVLEQKGRRVPIATLPLLRATGALLDRVEQLGTPGDRLFVGPADLRRSNYNDTFLYHLLPQFPPATYFLEMNPGSANRPNSRLAPDIRTADWLILNRAYDDWSEPNSSSRNGSDEPNRVVQTEFTPCGEFGPYWLFRRNSPRL
jgi:hypothetical protein